VRRVASSFETVRVGSGSCAIAGTGTCRSRDARLRGPRAKARGTSAPVCLTARPVRWPLPGCPTSTVLRGPTPALIESCGEWWRVGRARCHARAHPVRSARAARDAAARTRRSRARDGGRGAARSFRGLARCTSCAAGAVRCFRDLARSTARAAGAARCGRGLARRTARAAGTARCFRGLARDARSASRTARTAGAARCRR